MAANLPFSVRQLLGWFRSRSQPGLKAVHRPMVLQLIGIVFLLLPGYSNAEPVTYTFTTTNAVSLGPSLDALTGVTGQFSYDNGTASIATIGEGFATTGSDVYSNISDLSGDAAGNPFSDSAGIAIVGDDKLNTVTPPVDILLLLWEPDGAAPSLNGFTIEGWTLTDVRLQWVEGVAGTGELLETQDPPAILPTSFSGRLRLQFQDEAEQSNLAVYDVTLVATPPADADHDFRGPLKVLASDDGTGIYAGAAVGTRFSGSINRFTSEGFVSDGSTVTEVSCCFDTDQPGLELTDNLALDAQEAQLINSLLGTSMTEGDTVDLAEIYGDTQISGGTRRLETGLIFIYEPQAFDGEERNNYPPDNQYHLGTVYVVEEEDVLDDDDPFYLAYGVVDDQETVESSMLLKLLPILERKKAAEQE